MSVFMSVKLNLVYSYVQLVNRLKNPRPEEQIYCLPWTPAVFYLVSVVLRPEHSDQIKFAEVVLNKLEQAIPPLEG